VQHFYCMRRFIGTHPRWVARRALELRRGIGIALECRGGNMMENTATGPCERCENNSADSRGYAGRLCWDCSVEYVLDNPGPEECEELLVAMRDIAGDCSVDGCKNPALPEDCSAYCALHRIEVCGDGDFPTCACDDAIRAIRFVRNIVRPELFWPSLGGPRREE